MYTRVCVKGGGGGCERERGGGECRQAEKVE